MRKAHSIERSKIGDRIRGLRTSRRWTQAELAKRLGISQGQLSQVERGASSLTAEQFLVVLRLFNVPVSTFDPGGKPPRYAQLQNALARLGAADLRESEDVLPTSELEEANDAVLETLATGAPRLLTPLAPVLVRNADRIDLAGLHGTLRRIGLERRLGWLVENVVEALAQDLGSKRSSPWARRERRASLLLREYLESAMGRPPTDPTPVDILDRAIRSKKTLELVEATRSPISRRWGIVTRLQPQDFLQSLRSARVAA